MDSCQSNPEGYGQNILVLDIKTHHNTAEGLIKVITCATKVSSCHSILHAFSAFYRDNIKKVT